MFLPTLQSKSSVLLLPVEQIEPSPWQARRYFDEKQLSALAKSIQENGLLQPITVQKLAKDRYLLVAGERRLRACKLCGMKKIPAIITEKADQAVAVLSLEENLQRENLGPFEEAEAIRALQQLWQCSQTETASRLGISQPALANKLRLLTLQPDVRAACEAAGLTGRHIRALLRLQTPEQQLLAVQLATQKQMTVSQTEKLVEKLLRKPAKKPRCKAMVKDVRIFVNTVERAVGMMKSAGVPATMERTDTADTIEYRVRIPLSSAQKQKSAGPKDTSKTTQLTLSENG